MLPCSTISMEFTAGHWVKDLGQPDSIPSRKDKLAHIDKMDLAWCGATYSAKHPYFHTLLIDTSRMMSRVLAGFGELKITGQKNIGVENKSQDNTRLQLPSTVSTTS